MKLLAGRLLTPQGWQQGRLRVDAQGRIAAIEGRPITEAQARDGDGALLIPGFIDLHVHGGGGADVMDGGAAIDVLARLHARHGTTALLATTMSAPLAEIEAALHALAPACRERSAGAARVLGVHLEGPCISPRRLGAQPDCSAALDAPQVQALHRIAPLRVFTLAPEVPAYLALLPTLLALGCRVQIGHSDGTYEDACAALDAGASGFTHLFNAMSPLHQRAPGVAGAALAHAEYAELIPDLLHVHPGAIRAALRAVPRLYCVSDATAASGMPDGDYALGRQRVHKCAGGVRLADGTLAGSALTLDVALRNLVQIGLTLQEASARLSTHAAAYLGLPDRGALRVGARADLVMLDAALAVSGVFIDGEALV